MQPVITIALTMGLCSISLSTNHCGHNLYYPKKNIIQIWIAVLWLQFQKETPTYDRQLRLKSNSDGTEYEQPWL